MGLSAAVPYLRNGTGAPSTAVAVFALQVCGSELRVAGVRPRERGLSPSRARPLGAAPRVFATGGSSKRRASDGLALPSFVEAASAPRAEPRGGRPARLVGYSRSAGDDERGPPPPARTVRLVRYVGGRFDRLGSAPLSPGIAVWSGATRKAQHQEEKRVPEALSESLLRVSQEMSPHDSQRGVTREARASPRVSPRGVSPRASRGASASLFDGLETDGCFV